MAPSEVAGYFDEMIALLGELRAAIHEAHELAEGGQRAAAIDRSFKASAAARRLHRNLVSVTLPVVEHAQDLLRQARWNMRRGDVEEVDVVVEAVALLRRVESLVGPGR